MVCPGASIADVATIKAYNPLLPSKQAEVARRVLAAGFRKEDFAFRELQAREHITTLVYLPESDYRFEFYPGDNWIVNYSPADDTASSGEQGVGAWPYVLERVDWWLGCLMRELNVSDPWAGLFESVRSFDLGSGDDDNSPFSKTERETITRQLAEFKAYLLDEGVKSDADRHAVIATLGRIEDAQGQLGRLDWRSFAIGALMELALMGYATPDGVRYVVTALVGAAQHLLR